MEGVVENMPCLKTLDVIMIKGLVVLPEQLSGLGALQKLHIQGCDYLEYFPEHVLEGLTSLRRLSISLCYNLKSLSEGVRYLICLESLSIWYCPELVTLPSNMSQLTALGTVTIEGCSTLPYGLQCVPSLRTLHITTCRSTSLPDWLGDMTSLQKLEIWNCKELRSLPSSIQRLTNLSSLITRGCPYLEKRCKRETGEDLQYIKHIPEIKLFSESTLCVFAVADLDCMHDAMNKLNNDSKKINPLAYTNSLPNPLLASTVQAAAILICMLEPSFAKVESVCDFILLCSWPSVEYQCMPIPCFAKGMKLTDAAYVLDDILDDCSIHSTKMHSDYGHTSCLSPLHPKDILFRFNIGKRMKDITQRFHDIHEEKSSFNLELGVIEVQTVEDNWRQTSSDITEPRVYGRDHDREQIVKFLLEDASNSEDLSVYPIVGNVDVEDVGNKVWKKLYRRSFFQEAKSDELGMITSCKMHDLFHDLAQSIMGEECVIIEKGRLTPLSTRVHYASLLNCKMAVDMTAFKKVESLRTFLDLGDIGLVPSNHCLRALRTRSSLLFPLNDLAHLRYLSWNRRSGEGLNSIICQLPKLQILKLQDINHLRLLKELTQLQDLRHIVLNRNVSIDMPPNIGKLRHLRTLSTFVVGSKAGCGLAELHSLKLGGTLRIEGLENVPNEWDAKQANLIGKKDLNILHLSWGGSANSEGSNVNIERILEAMEPPSSLKSFEMKGYQGRQLSSWMRNGAVLRDLVEVTLWNCGNCKELPPLGKLRQLKRLEVGGMKNVKWIDGESYDGVEEKPFPSLEKLHVEDLPKLERMLKEEGVEMLPRLSRLRIDGVSNLKFPRLPSVEKLYARNIDEAASFMEGVGDMPGLKTLNIVEIKGLVVLPDQLSGSCETFDMSGEFEYQVLSRAGDSTKQYNPTNCPSDCMLLHITLWLTMCPGPTNFASVSRHVYFIAGLARRHHFSGKLKYLWDCEKLSSLPSSIQRLTNLSSLTINKCPYLKKRCKRETGEDWQYIKHIPEIKLLPLYEKKSSRFTETIRRSSSSLNCVKPAIKVDE
ncbi:hypothetical protein VNO80_09060 [Phaseolus coccineus]|uniref:NB-ARC domain-containing protein n=1 Tax=Phaseolus coccineus TaxID=3886 RepID=A0AAN9RDC2_PHACN